MAQTGGDMDNPAEIEFNVDGQYENEKGVFTVVSIDRDEMVIRWENGEEIRTDIVLQRRIAERRQWEQQKRKAAAEAALKPSRKSAAGKKSVFAGLAPTDFKKSASGTTWRSRNQLGTAVAQKIDTHRFKFNSWAFGNKPEMHVQDVKHHGRGEAENQAKFFVRVDPQTLYYGFRLARPTDKAQAQTEWDGFFEWLIQPENEQALRTIAIETQLAVCNLSATATGSLQASEEGWTKDGSGKPASPEALTQYITDIPEAGPLDLAFVASIDKDAAVASGPDIAKPIAQLFTRLLPLYQAATTR
jgi:hypothetical protein